MLDGVTQDSCEIWGKLEGRRHGGEVEGGVVALAFLGDGGVFAGGPGAYFWVEVLDYVGVGDGHCAGGVWYSCACAFFHDFLIVYIDETFFLIDLSFLLADYEYGKESLNKIDKLPELYSLHYREDTSMELFQIAKLLSMTGRII